MFLSLGLATLLPGGRKSLPGIMIIIKMVMVSIFYQRMRSGKKCPARSGARVAVAVVGAAGGLGLPSLQPHWYL